MTASAFIAAALRGETPPWPDGTSPAMIAGEAVAQGVAPLLASAPAVGSWPEPARRALREALLVEVARDTLIQPELVKLPGAFETAAVSLDLECFDRHALSLRCIDCTARAIG